METIQAIVRKEIYDFIHNSITVVDGYEFNQYENVKKTHLYLNSRFYRSGNTGTDQPLIDGSEQSDDDRIFFNITLPRVKAVKRFFDIDTKDPILDEIDPQSEIAIQLLNRDFDRFQEKHNLAKDYNDIKDPLIEYGSVVLKVLKNKKPKVIPLQDYFVDPTVERSAESRFNTIKHTMTPKMLRDKIADGWDKDAVEALISDAGKNSSASNSYEDDGGENQIVSSLLIDVYERYGWLPRHLVEKDAKTKDGELDETEVFTLSITGFTGNALTKKEGKQKNAEEGNHVLYKQLWKTEVPILDHHLWKTHGRWQGVGIVELLYPIQKRMNEIANQKRISMEISSLHLFQSADPMTLNNILTDLENGDIIKTKSPLSPIPTEERNLPAFDSEIVTYQSQGDKLSFANDLLSGGDVPSSTPATNAVIQNNNQVLVHLQDRQNFTNFVANEYIKRYVVPELIKEMSDEHYLRIVAETDDLLQLDDQIVDIKFWMMVKDNFKKGRSIDILLADDLKEEIRTKLRGKGPNRYVKVLKDYYKNKINDIQVHIGNEKKDFAKIANNTISFFSMLQNPAVLDDPIQRTFMMEYARDIGMDTSKLEIAFAKRDATALQAPQQAGSGGPRPKPIQSEVDPALAQVL